MPSSAKVDCEKNQHVTTGWEQQDTRRKLFVLGCLRPTGADGWRWPSQRRWWHRLSSARHRIALGGEALWNGGFSDPQVHRENVVTTVSFIVAFPKKKVATSCTKKIVP